jgi:foldase protein PrsA
MDKISASHILIMHKESKDSRSDLSKEEAQKLIDDLHTKVTKKKAIFKDMASKHSDCSSSKYGGSLGEFGKGVMVKAFEESAFSLKKNEISKPIETEFGFHIIKRDS